MSDTTNHGRLRRRAVVGKYLAVVVTVLVVLVILGGFLTYGAYGETNERTETTNSTEIAWTSTGQFTHQATVVRDTRVFDVSETLRNRSAYFQRVAPRLNGSFVYNYTADSGNLTADASLQLIVRSVDENDQEYWRIERALDQNSDTLAPGDSLRLSFSRNVTRIQQEIEQIRAELGTPPGATETTVVADVRLDGTRNGDPLLTERTYRLPLAIEDSLYRVNDSSPVVEQDERNVREQETVTVVPGSLWRYGGPLALIVGLLGLVGTVSARYTGYVPLSEREREYLAYRTEREEFGEWITEARFSAERVDQAETTIETTSLSGLVDLAIDSDRRVIEVADCEEYLVLDDAVCYRYDAPTLEDGSDDPLEPSDATAADDVPADDSEQSTADDGETTADSAEGVTDRDGTTPTDSAVDLFEQQAAAESDNTDESDITGDKTDGSPPEKSSGNTSENDAGGADDTDRN